MAKPQQAHIFVSYSRSDRIAVDKLVRDLRARHYRLWMDVDPQGIEPGENWREELIRQMSASQAVLACGSPDFLASPYCREEIAQAQREGKPIYPVLVRRLNAGQSLEDLDIRLQYADLTADYDAEFQRLIGVLPRPSMPTGLVLRYVASAVAIVAALVVLLGGIGLAVRFINPPVIMPTEVVIPTMTPSLAGYDLKVVVAPFVMDASLSEEDRRLANDLSLRLSRDMNRQIQALDGETQLDIGFLGADQIPPLEAIIIAEGDTQDSDQALQQRAASLAASRNFDMVFYAVVTRGEDNQLHIAPRLYIPPERFSEALEMTGAQNFGADIVLSNTSIDTAYQTSAELQSRVAALVHVIQGVSAYIARDYDEALQAFTAAADVPNWSRGRDTLYVLQGNVYLQLARDAITDCNPTRVMQQLQRAEDEYQQALGDNAAESTAGPAAALAEVFMLRSVWSLVEDTNLCDPQEINLDDIDAALQYSERAVTASDFDQLEPALQAAALFTQQRAKATLWYAVELTDPLFEQYADDINDATAQIITLYEANPQNLILTRTAFEAYFLRGTVQADYSGACGTSTLEDYQTALTIASEADSIVERSRQMFVFGALGQCFELNGATDDAIAQYRAAYNIARTLPTGSQDRDSFGCRLQLLTGDPEAADVTGSCDG